MPIKPLKACLHPFCPNLTADGKCTEHTTHESRQYERGRSSRSKRGYDRTWQKMRGMQLRREPFCQADGCFEQAEEVDHIVPLNRGGKRLDSANLQSLCKSCHSRKTANEDGGFGRQTRKD